MTKESTNSVKYSEVKTIVVTIQSHGRSVRREKTAAEFYSFFLFCKVGTEITKLISSSSTCSLGL